MGLRNFFILAFISVGVFSAEFKILSDIKYGDSTLSDSINSHKMLMLKSERLPELRMGKKTISKKGRTIYENQTTISSCGEYIAKVEAGYSTIVHFENSVTQAYDYTFQCSLLAMLKGANKASSNDLKLFYDLSVLPVTLLPFDSQESKDILIKLHSDGKSVKDLVDAKKIEVNKHTNTNFEIRYNNMELKFYALSIADTNKNGVDEVIVGVFGELGGRFMMLLEDTNGDGVYEFKSYEGVSENDFFSSHI